MIVRSNDGERLPELKDKPMADGHNERTSVQWERINDHVFSGIIRLTAPDKPGAFHWTAALIPGATGDEAVFIDVSGFVVP